jgi:hypothetical protein
MNVSMVPRREEQQASHVNSLSCPTFANGPIESQSIFFALSHPGRPADKVAEGFRSDLQAGCAVLAVTPGLIERQRRLT